MSENPKGNIRLSVVIVEWNTRGLLRDCLDSLYRTIQRKDFEVIVVDNNSTDASRQMVEADFPQVRLIVNSDNVGFAAANNQGMSAARGEYILCLNPDTVMDPGTVEKVLEFLENNPDYAAAGCRIRLPDGSYQTGAAKLFRPLDEMVIYGFCKYLHSAGIIRKHAYVRALYSDQYLRASGVVDYVIGAFVMIRREVLEKVGPLDPNLFFCGDDLDWGLRINKAGFKIKHLMNCEILHLANQSGKTIDRDSHEFQSSVHFWAKHYGLFGRLLFEYFKLEMSLRRCTNRILEKLGLFKYRHLVYAVYMTVCIPIETMFLIPLEIMHRLRMRKFASYKSLKEYEASRAGSGFTQPVAREHRE